MRANWASGAVVGGLFITACSEGGGDRPEVLTLNWQASYYNTQFLTPDPLIAEGDGGIDDLIDQWPNTLERAEILAQEAFAADCPAIVLVSELVPESRRDVVASELTARCGLPFRPYTELTLQHDWDIGERVLDGPKQFAVIIGEAAKQGIGAGDDWVDEVVAEEGELAEVPARALDELSDVIDELDSEFNTGSPVPVIHEEVAVLTRLPIVDGEQMEYSIAGGIDRLSAKGALYAALHVSDEKPPPPAAEFSLNPFSGSGAGSLDMCIGNPTTDCGDTQLPDPGFDLNRRPDITGLRPEGGATIGVMVTHLQAGYGDIKREQAQELTDFIDEIVTNKSARDLLVAGDLNLSPDSSDFADLEQRMLSIDNNFRRADLLATNNEGWINRTDEACELAEIDAAKLNPESSPFPACAGARHIDHMFWAGPDDDGGETLDAQLSYNPYYKPGERPELTKALEEVGGSSISDHAEVSMSAITLAPVYPPMPSVTTARRLTVDIGRLHLGGSDGFLCDEPDPGLEARLSAKGNVDTLSAGPTDDIDTLFVQEDLVVDVPIGATEAYLFLEAYEDDAWGCGGDDNVDISPDPNQNNLALFMDLGPNGAIYEMGNSQGIGWVNGGANPPVRNSDAPDSNDVTFSATIEEISQ